MHGVITFIGWLGTAMFCGVLLLVFAAFACDAYRWWARRRSRGEP